MIEEGGRATIANVCVRDFSREVTLYEKNLVCRELHAFTAVPKTGVFQSHDVIYHGEHEEGEEDRMSCRIGFSPKKLRKCR